MSKSIVIIGAGISGISCAITLINKKFKGQITIVEQGAMHQARICTVDKKGMCSECSPCNTISGFGGSVHYGDTVKLSCFPSGKRLSNIIGEKREEYQRIALSYFSRSKLHFITPSKSSSSFIEKEYPICTLHSNEVKAIIDDWYSNLSNNHKVDLLFNTKVTEIKKIEDDFYIHTASKENKHTIINAKAVVICTGRAGFHEIKEFAKDLGLKFKIPKMSIGFRFLMPNCILEKACEIHPDFKTSLTYKKFKYKTFCFSAGKMGGRIKHSNHGNFMLIDGHSITDETMPSKLSNFAILSQLVNPLGECYDYCWIEENIILQYIKLNHLHKGKPILQSYNDFKTKTVTSSSFEHLSKLNSKIYGTGNLSSLIPNTEQHLGFCHTLEILTQEFCRISEIRESLPNVLSQISVLGLELESIWNEMELNHNMETNIHNLFIAGDSAGIAQGILQASIGGIAAANGIFESVKLEM